MNEELQELMQNNPEWYKELQYQDVKVYIRDNINSASRSFVAIGYYLKYVRDNELFSEDGYGSIWEFAQGEFSIGKSSASQFMGINDKFSVEGNSPILLEQYKDFTSSKLAEMLTMTEEQLEQISPSTTIVEIREIKKPVETVLTSEQEMPSNCIHRPEYPCTLSEAQKVAQGDGVDCHRKCCWGCPEHGQCGYECNASAHRPAEPKTEITEDESDLPCDTCGYDVQGCCNYENEDMHCVCGDMWKPKASEPDPVETVEADIIQPEPEEYFTDQCETGGLKFNNWLKANNFSIAQIVSDILCDIPLANDKDPFLSSKVTNRLISSLIIKTDAYYSYLTKELDIEPEPVKSEQPELPLLRNNDQRKEFIDTYVTWPIWIDQELTGERYYRYDFDDKCCVVVKVYFQKSYSWGALQKEDHWGSNEYYLIENQEAHFKDCQTNMTALIDFLKDFQRKGV